MNTACKALKASVISYCSSIGANALLVQGAGGNASWKDEDTLWVKASGTWLAEAAEKDIFVPVDLRHIRTAIENCDFSIIPRPLGESLLRPSIETLLHVLMPHRVVFHLHPIEILAHLVRNDCQSKFLSIRDPSIRWAIVDYHKPGAALATAVNTALAQAPNINVIFLKNHGVVIGGDDVAEISYILNTLTTILSTRPVDTVRNSLPKLPSALVPSDQYVAVQNPEIHQLALNTSLFNRLDSDWALYPDHVVFLGAKAYAYKTWEAFFTENKAITDSAELIFIQGCGVFVKPTFSKTKYAQLLCYYEILVRQHSRSRTKSLLFSQIAELLNWDAEKYRQLNST